MEKKPNKATPSKTERKQTKNLKTIRTQFNKNYLGEKGEINTGEKITVPDQSLSIRELYSNHSRGLPSTISELKGEYFDGDVPDIQDLNDINTYREQFKQHEKEVNEKKKLLKQETDKRNKKAAIDQAKKELADEAEKKPKSE